MYGGSKVNMLQCVGRLAFGASHKGSTNRIRSCGGVVAAGHGSWKNHTTGNVELHLRGVTP